MKRLARLAVTVSERIAVFQITVAEFTIVAVCLIIAYGVVMRYAFRIGIPESWEMPGFLFLIITTFSLAYTQIKRRHINVDLLLDRLPGKAQNILRVFAYLVFFIFTSILLRAAVVKMTNDWVVRTDIIRAPLAPFFILLVIALVTLMFQLLVDMGKELVEFRRKPGQDG